VKASDDGSGTKYVFPCSASAVSCFSSAVNSSRKYVGQHGWPMLYPSCALTADSAVARSPCTTVGSTKANGAVGGNVVVVSRTCNAFTVRCSVVSSDASYFSTAFAIASCCRASRSWDRVTTICHVPTPIAKTDTKDGTSSNQRRKDTSSAFHDHH